MSFSRDFYTIAENLHDNATTNAGKDTTEIGMKETTPRITTGEGTIDDKETGIPDVTKGEGIFTRKNIDVKKMRKSVIEMQRRFCVYMSAHITRQRVRERELEKQSYVYCLLHIIMD